MQLGGVKEIPTSQLHFEFPIKKNDKFTESEKKPVYFNTFYGWIASSPTDSKGPQETLVTAQVETVAPGFVVDQTCQRFLLERIRKRPGVSGL